MLSNVYLKEAYTKFDVILKVGLPPLAVRAWAQASNMQLRVRKRIVGYLKQL